MQFDSFHGGSDARYSPSTDRYVYFDDLRVREGLCIDPGLDLFAHEASQNPITQLSDPFTGSYSRSFDKDILSGVGLGDQAAKTTSACMLQAGADHEFQSAEGSTETGEHGPCGDVNSIVTAVPVPTETAEEEAEPVEGSGAQALASCIHWHGLLSTAFVALLIALVPL